MDDTPILKLRLVEEADAEYILKLRLDENYNQFLSPVKDSLDGQRAWLRDYKEREKQGLDYYFITEYGGRRFGTIRAYDIERDSFRFGSFIMTKDKPANAAIRSLLKLFEFGFQSPEKRLVYFETHKQNIKFIRFQEKLGAKIIGEDENQYFYSCTRERYEKVLAKNREILRFTELVCHAVPG